MRALRQQRTPSQTDPFYPHLLLFDYSQKQNDDNICTQQESLRWAQDSLRRGKKKPSQEFYFYEYEREED